MPGASIVASRLTSSDAAGADQRAERRRPLPPAPRTRSAPGGRCGRGPRRRRTARRSRAAARCRAPAAGWRRWRRRSAARRRPRRAARAAPAAAAATSRSLTPCTSKRRPGSGGASAARGGRIALPSALASSIAALDRHARPQPGDHRRRRRRPLRIERDRRVEVDGAGRQLDVGGEHADHASAPAARFAGAPELDRRADDVRIRLEQVPPRVVRDHDDVGLRLVSRPQRRGRGRCARRTAGTSGRRPSRPTAARCRCWCAPSAAPSR